MIFLLIVIFLLLFYVFFSISFFADHLYLHNHLLFFAEKAMIALQSGFRLENIGFLYPPSSFIPFLFYNDPVIIPGIISALISGLLLILLTKHFGLDNIFLIYLVLLFLNPSYLFLATQRFDILFFYFLIALSAFYLVKYLMEGFSFYIFLSGILLGLTFFVDFRSLFALPFYVIGLYLSTERKFFLYRLAVVLVNITPIIFFLLSWLYLNWIFTGNPFYFIDSPFSFFRAERAPEDLLKASGSFKLSFLITIELLIFNIPMILPYIVVFLYMKKYKNIYLIPFYLIYLIPPMIIFFSLYYGIFFPYAHTSILFVLFSLMFSYHFKISRSPYLFLSMLVFFFSSFFVMLNSKDLNEKSFISVLLGKSIQKDLSRSYDLQTASVLISLNCRYILADDAFTFPVVYFTKDLDKFILPHNNIYFSALSNPHLFADCLLFSRDTKDFLNRRFPRAQQGIVPSYYLFHENSKYLLYVRQDMVHTTTEIISKK